MTDPIAPTTATAAELFDTLKGALIDAMALDAAICQAKTPKAMEAEAARFDQAVSAAMFAFADLTTRGVIDEIGAFLTSQTAQPSASAAA